MEPENQPVQPEAQPPENCGGAATPEVLPTTPSTGGILTHLEAGTSPVEVDIYSGLSWLLDDSRKLRAGWSVLLFSMLFLLFSGIAGLAAVKLQLVNPKAAFTAATAFWGELIPFIALLGAGALVALVERRRMAEFNLGGTRRTAHFAWGLAGGFAALSALIGALKCGGWLYFGPVALSGTDVARYAALWGCAFLLVGCVEEGMFRCYLQSTLTRGINFWWALGVVALLCGALALKSRGYEVWGVYAIALLGVAPCLWLHLKKAEGAGFWQAAWVTSTLFGFVHTGNSGENWIGIFAAAAIGFAFCVSIRVTGSAWWAIGFHAAWDWAETYFYGAADSGNVATGHYLTTHPAGNALWSGGADGPEGSVLVVAMILLLIALLAIYGKRKMAVATTAD